MNDKAKIALRLAVAELKEEDRTTLNEEQLRLKNDALLLARIALDDDAKDNDNDITFVALYSAMKALEDQASRDTAIRNNSRVRRIAKRAIRNVLKDMKIAYR